MMSRAIVLGAAICAAACGRLGFGLGDDDPAGDGAVGDTLGDGAMQANVVFTTRGTFSGALGGLEGADARCAMEATAANLPGTFVAFMSSSTVDARDRLQGSRGWVNTAGRPVADQVTDLFVNGRPLGVINYDAAGARLPSSLLYVWTGTNHFDGTADTLGTCGNWTSTANSGTTGFYTRSAPELIVTSMLACSEPARIYCFEIGKLAVVAPIASPGRIAFVSEVTSSSALGLTAYDAQCQTEASSAGLPGSYLAAVATTASSVAARFSGTTPWRRVDGTAVSTDAAHMFDGTQLLAPVNQRADGTYNSTNFAPSIRSGASFATAPGDAVSTCSDWSTTTGTGAIVGAPNEVTKSAFWANGTITCASTLYLLCLQE